MPSTSAQGRILHEKPDITHKHRQPDDKKINMIESEFYSRKEF
jgi:hypothetical protein